MYRKENIRQQGIALERKYQVSSDRSPDPNGDQLLDLQEKEDEGLISGKKENWKPSTHLMPNLNRSDAVDQTQTSSTGDLAEGGEGEEEQEEASHLGLASPGWKRFRTVMVTNIPPSMRDEQVLRRYFSSHLEHTPAKKAWKQVLPPLVQRPVGLAQAIASTPKQSIDLVAGQPYSAIMGEPVNVSSLHGKLLNPPVEDIIMIRKLGELGRLRERREDIVKQLEAVSVFRVLQQAGSGFD